MILSQVQITNYKQYIDEHTIPIPSAATVGVIGANGVGKTTLFEAIEWCLYNPTSIAAKDVRPRGRAGYTTVVVTLDVPSTGQQFLVERELKRSSTRAAIYRIEPDGDETIVVQGTRQVTDYVEKQLIGLSHSAFTATFFTRQKELSFFGDLGATARRREVGKLLGLETIRAAQQDIGTDRTGAMNEAKVLRARYEAESQGRDFAAEIDSAEKTIAASRAGLDEAANARASAKSRLESAEKDLLAQQELKDRDNAAAQKLLELRGEMGRAAETRQHIEANLARLVEREKERATLLPVAARTDALHAEDERLEGLRKIALRKRELEQHLLGIEQRRRDAIASVHSSVTRCVPPAALDGWHWHNGDSEDPINGCTRLLVAIQRIDIVSAQQHADGLLGLRTTDRDLGIARETLERYRRSRKEIEAQLATVQQAGDPATMLEATSSRISELQREESGIATRLVQLDGEKQKTQHLAGNLRRQQFDDTCPTCQRPFTEADARLVLDAFDAKMREVDDQSAALRQRQQAIRQEIALRERERTSIQERAQTQVKLRERIAASEPHIADAEREVETLGKNLQSALRAMDRISVPTEQDFVEATQVVHGWRRILDTREGIERARTALTTIDGQGTDLRRELATVGDVAYDEAAHAAVKADYRKALQAQSTVIQIDQDLARRPELETAVAECKDRLAAIGAAMTAADQERATIGFDPAKLDSASAAVKTAREGDHAATEHWHRVQATLRDAEHALDAVRKDQERIAKLATDADARQRDADRLDEMYREFTEFERFAAAWYAPRLSDITSEIVSEVTEGKYDRVVFDNNFGIDVYDGEEEKFPLETFSGGERDVIALAARIALSRVIGGQGAHPPGFLVLDEVFGSLDRERRNRLLDMLGAITSSGDHFRQIFMISHVDDVRTAPIFDELWLISESADGSSELQNLTPGADIGEL